MRCKAGMLGANRENGWDVSTATYVQSFSVASQESTPTAMFISADGRHMYVAGDSENVNQYSLSSAWDVFTASYVQSLNIPSFGDAAPYAVFLDPLGQKMFVAHSFSATVAAISEYSLSTAWDISTGSYVQNFNVASQDFLPYGLSFKTDGQRMYVLGRNGDEVHEYSLSAAWDVSTASFVQSFSVSSEDLVPGGLFFKPDGSRMYVAGATGDDINEYSLSAAWDISTASYVRNFSVASQDTSPQGVFFSVDGTQMYVVGNSSDSVLQYLLV